MTLGSAMGFRAAADARYRRTCVSWVPPVASVLRTLPHPVRIENRVHVDARTFRVVAAAPERTAAARRIERGTNPVLTRLVERAKRDENTSAIDRTPRPSVREPVTVHLQRRRQPEAQPVPPVPMVLARAAASPAPVVSTSSISASSGWSPGSSGHGRPAATTAPDTPPALSPADVNRLTDRVVAAIDRRLLAARERLGS